MKKQQLIKFQILQIWLLILISLLIFTREFTTKNNQENQGELKIQFSEKIALEKWQLINIESLLPKLSNFRQGYEYQYQENNQHQSLKIAVRYNSYFDGNVSRLVSLHENIKPATIRWQIRDYSQGHYAIFSYQQKLYLTACLNANGYTTVTEQQFSLNSYRNIWHWQSIINWLMGIKPLTDTQCWWILLSTDLAHDLSNSELLDLVKKIELTWQEWLKNFYEKIK